MITIRVADDFTKTPGAGTREQGPFSGQEFCETLLEPAYVKAKETGGKICIDLDGVYGYSPSFIREAFGGLARKHSCKCWHLFAFISNDQPQLPEKIRMYIMAANGEGVCCGA